MAVSESGGDKVFVLKTPLSDSELICLEYRKWASDPNQYDYRIPTTELLMYRVDNKVDGLTNNADKNKLTFTVTFADYSQYGVWDKLDEGNSGNTGDSGSTGGDSGDTGDSGNTGTDTGDGENMEWSDDYL